MVHVLVVYFGVVHVGNVHAAAHEIVEVRMVDVAQGEQLVGFGKVDARFPFRDGLAGYAELLCKGFLGDAVMLANVDEIVRKAHGFKVLSRLGLLYPMCGVCGSGRRSHRRSRRYGCSAATPSNFVLRFALFYARSGCGACEQGFCETAGKVFCALEISGCGFGRLVHDAVDRLLSKRIFEHGRLVTALLSR